jgi:hypothetical protein
MPEAAPILEFFLAFCCIFMNSNFFWSIPPVRLNFLDRIRGNCPRPWECVIAACIHGRLRAGVPWAIVPSRWENRFFKIHLFSSEKG